MEFKPGEMFKTESGRPMMYLHDNYYLTVDGEFILTVVQTDNELEKLGYEHLTVFLRNRFKFLMRKFGTAELIKLEAEK